MDKIQYIPKQNQLNEFPVFNGKTIDKMPELKTQGYDPISIAGIMDLRNKAFKSNEKDWIQEVCYNYFDSGDGIVYHPDGRIKIDCDSQNLRDLTSKSKLENFSNWSALNLEKEKRAKRFDELPEEINGVQLVFDPKEIKEFTGKYLKEDQVLKNKFWLAFARGDENRLGNYVQNVYSRINEPEFMEVWIANKKPDFEAEMLLSISSLDYQSDIDGGSEGSLDANCGRLVGIVPTTMQSWNKVDSDMTKINLEALLQDLGELSNAGNLTPKTQAIYENLQTGKYNL